MDAELLAKLQHRRGVVDTTGDEWETSPEASSADARAAEWIISETAGAAARTPSQSSRPAGKPAIPAGPVGGAGKRAGEEAAHVQEKVEEGPEEEEVVPDEGALRALLAQLKALGRTDAGRQLLLAQPPAVRRALGELLKSQPQQHQQSATAGSADVSRSADKQEERAFALGCAQRWPQLLKSVAGVTAAAAAGPSPGAGAGAAAELAEADLRTIRVDADRTRKGDPAFREQAMKERLEKLLVGFCEQEKIRYTQGLHEVAAAFAFIQASALEGEMSEGSSLSCLIAFVHRFVPYFHDDEAFVTLHISLLFFRQLILYHHPDLHNQLAEAGVSPLLYATPWFITLFSAKTPMPVLLSFWDRYIVRDEETFLPFVALAMLVCSKSSILSAGKDEAHSAVGRAGLSTMQHLNDVWAEAEALRARTPKSFEKRLSRVLDAVRERRAVQDRAWTEHVLGRVEKERRFAVLPQEVVVHCLQEQSASAPSKASKMRFLLLDLRPPEEQALESLPQALHFYPPCLRRLIDLGRGSQPRLERLAATLSSAVRDFLSRDGTEIDADRAGSNGDADSASVQDPKSLRPHWDDDALVREVFDELQQAATQRWGLDWLSDSACAHLVLLGGAADTADFQNKADGGGAVAPLYEALTEHLSFARVSVALGGVASVLKVARSNGLGGTTQAAKAGGTEAAEGHESFFGSAWSRLQAATEALPPRELAGERLGGLWQGAARGLKEGAAVVRQQAAEGAAVVRQQAADRAVVVQKSAAGGMSAIGTFLERFDQEVAGGYPAGRAPVAAEAVAAAVVPQATGAAAQEVGACLGSSKLEVAKGESKDNEEYLTARP